MGFKNECNLEFRGRRDVYNCHWKIFDKGERCKKYNNPRKKDIARQKRC